HVGDVLRVEYRGDDDAAVTGTRVGPQPAGHLAAVDARQLYVDDHRVRRLGQGAGQALLPALGPGDAAAEALEVAVQQVQEVSLVLDDKHVQRAGGHGYRPLGIPCGQT